MSDLNLSQLQSEWEWHSMAKDFPHTPDVLPVSIRDIEINPPMDMDLNVSDPCPRCGAFRMKLGDYVCWGFCSVCYEDAESKEDY